jgi:thiol-disulfide isomerase/thioredoxin
MRRAALPLLLALLLGGCNSGDEPKSAAPTDPAAAAKALKGAPAPLAALHEQSNERLDGGAKAFKARLEELRGHPAVVNKWASWCAPCRAEFPFFQKQALARGKEVAFLGVNSNDNAGDARRFLAKYPVPFPHYTDRNLEVAAVFNAVQAFPSTAFYDSKGKLAYVQQGGYSSERKLAEDIERYAR